MHRKQPFRVLHLLLQALVFSESSNSQGGGALSSMPLPLVTAQIPLGAPERYTGDPQK